MLELAKRYLTQKSTYLGLFKVAAAVGLFSLTPELETEFADSFVQISSGIIGVIGAYFVIKDEDK